MSYAYALLSTEEAKRALKQESATDPQIIQIAELLDIVSQELNDFFEREIIENAWTEYHQYDRAAPSTIRILHWPISTVTEIREDESRAYGTETDLTEGTDFVVNSSTGEITRISSGYPIPWLTGFETIRVKLTGGWALADVPPAVKGVCAEYLARHYHARMKQEYSFSTIDDARGTVTHFGPVMLTKPMMKRIYDYKDHGATTCVRYTTT